MQNFKTFETRRVTIKRARESEIDDYKNQLITHSPVEDKLNVINTENVYYLSIKNEDKKLLGLIQVDEIDEKTAHIKICIPNKSWSDRYGKEALHQFIKCCKERKLYNRLYFKKSNTIVQEYNRERPDVFNANYYIDIA